MVAVKEVMGRGTDFGFANSSGGVYRGFATGVWFFKYISIL